MSNHVIECLRAELASLREQLAERDAELAALKAKRRKRTVEIWEEQHTKELHIFNDPIVLAGREWRKVAEVELDA